MPTRTRRVPICLRTTGVSSRRSATVTSRRFASSWSDITRRCFGWRCPTCAPRSAAEEVVQDTWLGVLRGLRQVRGPLVAQDLDLPHPREPGPDARRPRAPLGAVLIARGRRRSRGRPRPVPARRAAGPCRRGRGATARRRSCSPPRPRSRCSRAIDELTPSQREVITLRDVEGWPAAEVRDALGLSEANERVLLHRARSKVRARLEAYFAEVAA